MKTNIYNKVVVGVSSFLIPLSSFLFTSCKDSFLEVTSPTDTFIEEYYTTKTSTGTTTVLPGSTMP